MGSKRREVLTTDELKPSRMVVAIHPGPILQSELATRGISQARFAKHIGSTQPYVSDIINGKRGITATMAFKIGSALGTGPEVWMNLQMKFDLDSVLLSEYEDIEELQE